MTTIVWLTVISVVGAAALFIALAIFLGLIIKELAAIGGAPTGYNANASLLSKIRMGLRAIERQTDGLVPYVTELNERLTSVRDGVLVIDTNLAGVITNVSKQEAP